MHDLQPVPALESCLTPAVARHNLEIALNGDPVGRQFQRFKQRRQREPFRDFLLLAVQVDRDQSGLPATSRRPEERET